MQGVSIIICTYNGARRIKWVLDHICKLKTDCLWELIIVNNASTDNTEEVCRHMLSGSQIDFSILLEMQQGLSFARICGMKVAKYDFILYCDDDNALSASYLEIGFSILQRNPKIGALGGCGIPLFESDKPEWFDQYSHSYALGPQSSKDGKCSEFPAELYGACTFLKREPLLNLFKNGFKTALTGRKGAKLVSGDDVEWCYLLQLLGYEIWYDSRLEFTHIMPASRLKWEYYLKLKQAITLGSAAFLPYKCLFENRNMSKFNFMICYIKDFLYAAAVWLKNLIWVSGISEKDLSLTILHARVKSYMIYPIVALRHFRQLKSVF